MLPDGWNRGNEYQAHNFLLAESAKNKKKPKTKPPLGFAKVKSQKNKKLAHMVLVRSSRKDFGGFLILNPPLGKQPPFLLPATLITAA